MIDCACVYVGIGDRWASLFRRTHPRAIKEHRCGECGRTIMAGEKYECVVGNWFDKIDCYKTCSDCESIRDHFFYNGHHYEMVLKDLAEHVRELDGQLSADCILPLTPAARDIVFAMIEEVWQELNEMEEEEEDNP